LALSACSSAGGFFCPNQNCGVSDDEQARIIALALPDPVPSAPPDPTNRYADDANASALGKMLYHDTRFAGPSNQLDALNRMMPFGRMPVGQNAAVGCVTCHSPGHAGADPAGSPADVSVGAGWTFANGLSTFNAAFYDLHLWNGRADSLWAQAANDNENALTTNGNRLNTAWLIAKLYAGPYATAFPDYPLPMDMAMADVQAMVGADGQCALSGSACPASCRSVTSTTTGATGCWPRFPLQGKPGKTAGCQTGDAKEPFGDAFDCMDPADQMAVTRVLVNFGKAIAAYERQLITGRSPFDRWVDDLRAGNGDASIAISDDAKRGARLFVGKAGCSDCHYTSLLSDNRLHNVGVGQRGAGVPTEADCPAGTVCNCAGVSDSNPGGPNNCIPWGARDGIGKLQKNAFNRMSAWSDQPSDPSMGGYLTVDVTTIPKGTYRTPSLRNVALTAPYMHDGAIATLADVVWHYNQAVPDESLPGEPAPSFRPLYLAEDEEYALVEFLESLTGDPPAASVIAPPTLP
jgi:cytochrome c peroxidase